MKKECVNCPGAEDHSTAECPVVREQSKIDAERAGFNAYLNEVVEAKQVGELTIRLQRHDEYTVDDEKIAWDAWQARASLPVGVPDGLIDELRNHAAARTGYTTDLIGRAADVIEKMLEPTSDRWASHKEKFCGCKDASRLNQCRGLDNCELPCGHPDRKTAAPTVKESLSVAPTVKAEQVSAAARDILAERQRQITAEGYDSSHDDMATRGQLAIAAGCYAMWSGHPALMGRFSWKAFFPWDWKYWKPSTPRHNLIKAGALILAEIERLDRAEQAKQQEVQL